MKRIKILGAGLSGLSAAINLAKAGYEVDVFETNKDVGQKYQDDLQGLENWSEKEDILEHLTKMNIEKIRVMLVFRVVFTNIPFSDK